VAGQAGNDHARAAADHAGGLVDDVGAFEQVDVNDALRACLHGRDPSAVHEAGHGAEFCVGVGKGSDCPLV
jgi:hypothetical protein